MKKTNYKSLIILLSSVILGSILGLIFGDKISFLKPFGDIFLNLMFTLAVPLIFFTVASSIASMSNLKRLSKTLKYTFIIFLFTSLIAAIIMFISLKVFNPVTTNIVLENEAVQNIDILDKIVNAITVNDFYNLFSKNNILPLIIFSILFGISLNLLGDKTKMIVTKIDILSKAMLKMVHIVMYYAPIGLCAYFASLVGEYGKTIIGSYTKAIIIYYIVTLIYFILMYSIYSYIYNGRKGIKMFWKNIIPSIITSLATQSSLATLPVNMEVSSNMNISKDISKVSLPLETTMHMEGSSMGAILKIIFVFSLIGISFTPLSLMKAFIIAVLSSVVMAGIPGGGLIGEMLIINLYGLPMSCFPIIATIGILIDPPATMLNATGDITSTMMISKLVDK